MNIQEKGTLSAYRKEAKNQILTKEECLEIIKKKLNQNFSNFILIDYEIETLQDSQGFLAKYFYLKTIVSPSDSPTKTEKISFFIKAKPPKNTHLYDQISKFNWFKIEIGLYTKIFSELLDSSDRKYIPECFLGLEDKLVLEDLIPKGFKTVDKLNSLDFDHCKVVMENLGKFHAQTLIFEERQKMTLLEFCKKKEVPLMFYGNCRENYDPNFKALKIMIDGIPELDNLIRKQVKKEISEGTSKFYNVSPSGKYRNVLSHTDLWCYNILFKHDSNLNCLECIFVDFQMAGYSPPAFDLMVFFYYMTTRKFRNEHLESLLRIYYNSLDNSLKKANLDISKIIPRKDFMESIEEYKVPSLIRVLGVYSTCLCEFENSISQPSKEITSIVEFSLNDPISFVIEQCNKNQRYKERLTDILLELYEITN